MCLGRLRPHRVTALIWLHCRSEAEQVIGVSPGPASACLARMA